MNIVIDSAVYLAIAVDRLGGKAPNSVAPETIRDLVALVSKSRGEIYATPAAQLNLLRQIQEGDFPTAREGLRVLLELCGHRTMPEPTAHLRAQVNHEQIAAEQWIIAGGLHRLVRRAAEADDLRDLRGQSFSIGLPVGLLLDAIVDRRCENPWRLLLLTAGAMDPVVFPPGYEVGKSDQVLDIPIGDCRRKLLGFLANRQLFLGDIAHELAERSSSGAESEGDLAALADEIEQEFPVLLASQQKVLEFIGSGREPRSFLARLPDLLSFAYLSRLDFAIVVADNWKRWRENLAPPGCGQNRRIVMMDEARHLLRGYYP